MSEPITLDLKNGLEISLDAIVIVNDAGQIVIANSQAASLFGYSVDDLIGQSVDMLLPERLRVTHPLHRKRYFQEPHSRAMGAGLQLFGLKSNGDEFPVDIELRPMPIEGKINALAYIRDRTTQNKMEQAILAIEGRITEFRAISVDVSKLKDLVEMHVTPLVNRLTVVEETIPQLSTRVDEIEESVNDFKREWKDVRPTFERIDRTFERVDNFAKHGKRVLYLIGGLVGTSVVTQLVASFFHWFGH